MIFKFTTLLQWFEVGETFADVSIWMEWYCYNPDTDNGKFAQGFNFKQVPLLDAYMKSSLNFLGVVSYQPVYEEDIPLIAPDHFIKNPEGRFPEFLIINASKEPQALIPPYINIQLCKENELVQHDYNLEFAIIGKVLGLSGVKTD